jgi:hypothetical protein
MGKLPRVRCVRPGLFIPVLLTCLLAGSLVGCSNTPAGGDPGDVRLNLLAGEQVFASLPPGSRADGPIVRTPARYAGPGFAGGGWHGPAVTMTFTNPGSPTSVFSYYQSRVVISGWAPTGNRNVLGYPQVWTKTYTGGSDAYLMLTHIDPRASGTGQTRYVLNASA